MDVGGCTGKTSFPKEFEEMLRTTLWMPFNKQKGTQSVICPPEKTNSSKLCQHFLHPTHGKSAFTVIPLVVPICSDCPSAPPGTGWLCEPEAGRGAAAFRRSNLLFQTLASCSLLTPLLLQGCSSKSPRAAACCQANVLNERGDAHKPWHHGL